MAGTAAAETGQVVEILNDNSLILRDGAHLRLGSLLLPLPALSPGDRDEPFAAAAHDRLDRLLAGQVIAYDLPDPRADRWSRLAAQVRVGRIWVQEDLLRRGLARVRGGDAAAADLAALLAIEGAARDGRVGLWRLDRYRPLAAEPPTALRGSIGRFVLVEGRVVGTDKGRFLNFGADWRSDFTAVLTPNAQRRLKAEGDSAESLVGMRVRVRGWLDQRNGPSIEIDDPVLIETLGE